MKLFGSKVLPILQDLNATLPEYMFVTGYSQTADQAEVTIHSAKDD